MPLRVDTRLALRSFLVLLGVFLPVLVLALALLSKASLQETLGTFPNAYVAFLPATIVGGIALIALLVAVRRAERGSLRAWAFVLAPVVAVGWPATGIGDLFIKSDYLTAFGVACVAFGAAMWNAAKQPLPKRSA
jgi:hypothetical protein